VLAEYKKGDEMKTYNEISNLKYSAEKFETFWVLHDDLAVNPYSGHKYVAGFKTDKDRDTGFSVFVHFNRCPGERDTGYLKFGDINLAQEYMRRAMNCLSKELFAKCAKLMKADAAKMVEAAKAELKTMQETLDDILGEAKKHG
jgi:hypothetical protein